MHNLRLTLSFPVTVCVKIDPAGVAIAEGHIADVLNKKCAGELLFGGQLLRHAVDQFQTLLATHLDVADGEVFVNVEIRDDNTVDETVAVKLEEYEP